MLLCINTKHGTYSSFYFFIFFNFFCEILLFCSNKTQKGNVPINFSTCYFERYRKKEIERERQKDERDGLGIGEVLSMDTFKF
jgi:hypothetical protein